MGLIQLFISFDNWGIQDMLMGGTVESKDRFSDFTSDWYSSSGNKICLFLVISSFISNFIDLSQFVIILYKRWRDRRYKFQLKYDLDDEDDDQPNSRIKIQGDLEELYTGPDFRGEKAYSRMMSTLFVIQLFCSGMPVMYMIGAVFYTVTFIINKVLILKFYNKSRTFTRTIPLFSSDFFKYGLILHMFMALIMLTTPEIFETKDENQHRISIVDLDEMKNYTSFLGE